MRFKPIPFTHPEYEALRKRNEPLSVAWGMGHVFFVVFLAIAFAIPFGIVMLMLVDPEILKDRVWDVGGGAVAAALMVAAIGFAVRQYASRKGRKTNEAR